MGPIKRTSPGSSLYYPIAMNTCLKSEKGIKKQIRAQQEHKKGKWESGTVREIGRGLKEKKANEKCSVRKSHRHR